MGATVHAECWDLQFYRSSMGQKYETALIGTQVEKQRMRIEEARRQAAQVRAQTEVGLEYGKANITVFEATQAANRYTIITATQTEAETQKVSAEANVSQMGFSQVQQADGKTLTSGEYRRYQQLLTLTRDLPKAPLFKSLSLDTTQIVAAPNAADRKEL